MSDSQNAAIDWNYWQDIGRRYRDRWWSGICRFFSTSFGRRFQYESDGEWNTANSECMELDVRSDVNYLQAETRASKYYDEVVAIRAALDKKAEWLFGIAMAASAGVVSLATRHIDRVPPLPRLVWFPCLLLLAYAMLASARAKLPASKALPVPGTDLVQWANDAPNEVSGWMAASMYVASLGVIKTNDWKCRLLNYSAIAMTVAVAWFGVALAIFATL